MMRYTCMREHPTVLAMALAPTPSAAMRLIAARSMRGLPPLKTPCASARAMPSRWRSLVKRRSIWVTMPKTVKITSTKQAEMVWTVVRPVGPNYRPYSVNPCFV